jgi:hypothetical protein
MDGGKEAVNAGLLRVASNFANAKSTREVPYIEAYNTCARRWRELCMLADRPNAHATPHNKTCARCAGTGCRYCDYTGTNWVQVTCALTNCETCRFGALCRELDINLMHMPETGPWQPGYAPPATREGWSREGRVLPGQLVVTETPAAGAQGDRRVFYVVAPLDDHTYLGVRGRQPRVLGGRAASWEAPQFRDVYHNAARVVAQRVPYNREGQEVMVSSASTLTGQPLTAITPIDPSWTVPELGIADYEDVRNAIDDRG